MPGSDQPYDERYCHRGLDRLQDDTLLWTSMSAAMPTPRMAYPGSTVCSCSNLATRAAAGKVRLDVGWGSEGSATSFLPGRSWPPCVISATSIPRILPGSSSIWEPTPDARKPRFQERLFDEFHRWRGQLDPASNAHYGLWPNLRLPCSSERRHRCCHSRYPLRSGAAGESGHDQPDQGQTWEDEVYYLDSTNFTGSYSASLVLDDDTILTIAASSVGHSWESVKDQTDLYAIRWKPVKNGQPSAQ